MWIYPELREVIDLNTVTMSGVNVFSASFTHYFLRKQKTNRWRVKTSCRFQTWFTLCNVCSLQSVRAPTCFIHSRFRIRLFFVCWRMSNINVYLSDFYKYLSSGISNYEYGRRHNVRYRFIHFVKIFFWHNSYHNRPLVGALREECHSFPKDFPSVDWSSTKCHLPSSHGCLCDSFFHRLPLLLGVHVRLRLVVYDHGALRWHYVGFLCETGPCWQLPVCSGSLWRAVIRVSLVE